MSTKLDRERTALLQGTLDLLITCEDGTSENNRRAKFYRLTAKGVMRLTRDVTRWERFAGAAACILRPTTE